ncbi:MAG: surface-adhesin E family protein, partial [Smithella sp.]
MKTNNIQGFICLAIYFLFAHQALAADWVYFASNSARDSYYDKSNIIKADKNIIRVWTKQILSENGKVKKVSNLKSNGKECGNLDLISYILKLSEIDCVNKKIKDSSVTFYDEKSNLLYSSLNRETGNWDDIVPHSVAEKLKNILCEEPVAPADNTVAVTVVNNKDMVQLSNSQTELQYVPEEDIRNLVNKWLTSW